MINVNTSVTALQELRWMKMTWKERKRSLRGSHGKGEVENLGRIQKG